MKSNRMRPFRDRSRLFVRAALALVFALAMASCNDDDVTGPDGPAVIFRVRVGAEEFRFRTTDSETIRLARENMQGGNSKHPHGPISPGDGGFNQPYSWHHLTGSVRMVDTSIELCDGSPSYVESHRSAYLVSGYCPWGARVVAEE